MSKKNGKKKKSAEVKVAQKMTLADGVPSIKDLMAPPSFDRSSPDHICVGDKFVRSFVLAGYPKTMSVSWADSLYNYEGDLDIALHVNPTDERAALDELTNKITQFEAQLETEVEKGSNRNVTRLRTQINELYEERSKVEQNYISLFNIQFIMNLYCNSNEQLNKESQMLDNGMRGRKIKLMPLYLQQDDGYKSALPFGRTWLPKMVRNFSSEGLTACFLFYNAEVSHENGVFVGVNLETATPIFIDFYDRKLLNSGNAVVFGVTGSGKTFLLSLLTMRSALKKIRTTIIDPEGEFRTVTEALGGAVITIGPDSSVRLNPFDIEEEEDTDEEGSATGRFVVKIKDKIADLLNLIGVMCGTLSQEQRSLISYVLAATYEDFGFTANPESLYSSDVELSPDGRFVHNGKKKPMPTISDFLVQLDKYAKTESNQCLSSVYNILQMFRRDGVYGMFDSQTSESIVNYKTAPVVTFDVSGLEENILRPIGMYVALSWAWEKFAKKDLATQKRIICDEGWMLVNRNMAGYEYTAKFLETTARRIRKRNGSLLVASQNFKEFADNPQGRAVLTNATVKILLQQNATDIDDVQDIFKLSDGERDFLLSASKGNFLLRLDQESSVGYALPFEYEKYLIERRTVAGTRK